MRQWRRTTATHEAARILAVCGRSWARDDIVNQRGAHKMWIARHYDCYEPNTCLSTRLRQHGLLHPGCVRGKTSLSEKVLQRSVASGFMMNSQELETAVREHVPL